MPRDKVITKLGNIFETISDAIVIPMEPNKPIDDTVIREMKEHFGLKMDPISFHNKGQLNIIEYKNNRHENLKPSFHLLIPIISLDSDLSIKVIVDMMGQISSFSKSNPNVRDIAIFLPDLNNNLISDYDGLQLMTNIFTDDSSEECVLEVFVDDERRYFELREEVKRNAMVTETMRNLKPMTWNKDLLKRDFYIAKSYQDDIEIFDTFFEKSVWYAELDAENLIAIQEVNVGSFLFLDYSPDRSETQISIQAIGEVTAVDKDLLHVNWAARNFMAVTKNRNYPNIPLYQITQEYIKKELLDLYSAELFKEGKWDEKPALSEIFDVPQSVTELNNDSDRGIDYLDIADDVNAFARIIALKKFRPPLAIALCGKWGSGKSFFINKMVETVDQLVLSNTDGLFCSGIVHIRFNAWSYMDSNLWASMVSKIFSGLNDYINDDEAGPEVKKKIKIEIQEKLNLTKGGVVQLEQERVVNEQDIEVLKNQKSEVKKELTDEINKLRSKSLKSFITKVDQQFQIAAKIDEALDENKAAAEVKDFVKGNFPKEIWGESDYLKKELASGYVFFLEFFRRDRFWWNVLISLVILAVIWFFSVSFPGILAYLKVVNIKLSAQTLMVMTIAGSLATRFLSAYKHVKPLFSALWKINAQYKSQLADAKFRWEQQEKAIKIELEIKKDKIAWIDEQLIEHETLRNRLVYRLDHTLNTEALSRFVSEKSSADSYRKQQGIIATIREDFEILTDLFIGANKEKENGNERSVLNKPLERIILYIDDLDRCSEERIVEVLEAVHLLMAFELFVVVAGIDPEWVKGALRNKRVPLDQDEREQGLNTASFYLEKIFQIPFHLKPAPVDSIRNMIRAMSTGKNFIGPVGEKQSSKIGDFNSTNSESIVFFPSLEIGQSDQIDTIAGSAKPELSSIIETLILKKEEIDMLSEFAVLLGPNPRAIKRFVNTYQIIRAHGGLDLSAEWPDIDQRVAIMFLLALNIGKFNDIKEEFYKMLNTHYTGKLTDFFRKGIPDAKKQERVTILQEHLSRTTLSQLKNTDLKVFDQHREFVCRFSFD